MSDHDFEKQVQQKLDELKLRPSDTVWMEVQKNIRTTKRRRRFFWLWTPMLLICLSTSAYILYRHYFKAEQTTGIAQTASSSKPNQLTSDAKTTNSVNANPVNDKVSGNSQPEQTVAGQVTSNTNNPTVQQNEAPAVQKAARPSSIAEQAPGNTELPATFSPPNSITNDVKTTFTPTAKSAVKKVVTATNFTAVKKGNRGKKNTPVGHFERNQPAKENRGFEEKTYNSSNSVNTPQVVSTEHQTEQAQEDFTASIPGIVNDDIDSIIATDKAMNDSLNKKMISLASSQPLNNTPAVAAVPISRKRISAWHWGIEANAGFSRISTSNLFHLKGLLEQDKYIAEDLAARSSLNSALVRDPNSLINIQTTSNTEKKAAPIQPDLSFTAGFFVERTFSRRLRLSAGVQYTYMSVYTEVGEQVVSNTPVLVNYGQTSAGMVHEYYNYAGVSTKKDTGSSITNAGAILGAATNPPVIQRYKYSFHYVEIPVMLHWQINKGRRLPPIVCDGGFSVARLTKVKALHYDGIKGIYYKDNSLFNKTQWNVITGISVGIFQKTKHPLWVGPNLRYSFSGLVKKEASTGQYLWSTGITVKMLLGRL